MADDRKGPTSSNEALRRKGRSVIDQRQQQIDPAGKHRADPNGGPNRSQKQPGQDLSDPQDQPDDGE